MSIPGRTLVSRTDRPRSVPSVRFLHLESVVQATSLQGVGRESMGGGWDLSRARRGGGVLLAPRREGKSTSAVSWRRRRRRNRGEIEVVAGR